MYQIIDMYLYRELCACVVLSFLRYPRPVRVWMGFSGLSSPWAVYSICVSLSRSPQKRPTQTNDIIRLRLPLREEKLWAELSLAFCLVSLQTPSSRSLVKRDLDGLLCTAVLSQFIWREIIVLDRQQCTELPHTTFYSTTKQFSAILFWMSFICKQSKLKFYISARIHLIILSFYMLVCLSVCLSIYLLSLSVVGEDQTHDWVVQAHLGPVVPGLFYFP